MSMPRKARTRSATNIYHVMLRGINKQVIFENDDDRRFFLNTVKKCKEESGFRLYAFCLMTNHVHLLLEMREEPLEIVFKRIGTTYAKWYNRKYERVGHLFQDRFRSENVETPEYFMTVLRYILWNPVKAGMVSAPDRYRWSSYQAYERGEGLLTDTAFAESVFGSRDSLIAFCRQENDDTAMDDNDSVWRIQDDEAIEVMSRISKCASISEFQQLKRETQRTFIRKMYLEKLSAKQISRITGITMKTIAKAVAEIEPDQLEERNSLHFRESDQSAFEYEAGEEIW